MAKVYKEYPDKNWTPCKTPATGYDKVYELSDFLRDSKLKCLKTIDCCDYHHEANIILSRKHWKREEKRSKPP